MTWKFLGIRLDPSAAERFVQNIAGAAEDVVTIVEQDPLKAAAAIAVAVVLPQVVTAVGVEILAATEIATGLDFVAAVDAINSVTGLSGLAAANAVGQAAFTASSTGGDLSQTLQTVLTNATGIYVDSTITDAFDSKLAGSVVRAGTLASLNDQDVGQAVGLQLVPASVGVAVGTILKNVGSTVDNFLFPNETGFIDPSELVGFDEWNIPPTDFVPSIDFGYDWAIDGGDVVVSLEELEITGPVTIDESALQMTGFDPEAVIPDDDGDLYNVSGQTVAYTAKTYANSLYVDPQTGDVYGPDNIRRLTANEAAGVVAAGAQGCSTSGKSSFTNVAGLGAVCLSPQQSIAQEVQRRMAAQAGQIVIPGPGVPGRPANIPPPNPNGVKLPEAVGWAAAAEMVTKSAANVWAIITQVSNGTYRPGASNPYGTLRPPVPGVPVTNRDGSVTVNNGNGTQTVTYPNGTRTTMSTAVAGAGGFGGISTNTLLLVGAGLAATLLLRRK